LFSLFAKGLGFFRGIAQKKWPLRDSKKLRNPHLFKKGWGIAFAEQIFFMKDIPWE